MSVISRLVTLGAAGAGGETGWILTVDDPSYPILFADVDSLEATTGNLIVVGHQDSNGEDGIILEVDKEGGIVSQRIQNNNRYTYYNNVFQDPNTGDIYTGGAIEPVSSIQQGITRFNNATTITASKRVDISGGNAGMVKPFYVTGNYQYKAVVAARGTSNAYTPITGDLSIAQTARYISISGSVGLRSICQNQTSVAILSENFRNNRYGFDVVSQNLSGNYDFLKGFHATSAFRVEPPDMQGYNGIKGYYGPGETRLAVAFNTNAFGVYGCGILSLTAAGGYRGDTIMCVNDGGNIRTFCSGVEPDTASSDFYKPVYIYGNVNFTDGFVFRNTGYSTTYSDGLRISGPQSGDVIELSGAVSPVGDFVYLVGYYTYNNNRQGIIMKLPKDLSVTGTFNGWTLSTPTVSTALMGLIEETTPLSSGSFTAGLTNASTSLNSYSTTSSFTKL